MNGKLIFGLSMFGLLMAIGTVFFIPMKAEPVCWIVILVLCAWLIVRNAPGKYFLHGFLVCLLNCVWITGAHIFWSATYLASHADEARQYEQMNAKLHCTSTQAMLIFGPIIGVATGLFLGLLSFILSRVSTFKKKA
jgi:hypothetical protein